MRRPIQTLLASALAAVSAFVALAPAQAADPIARREQLRVTQNLPFCDDARVLAQIEDQFEYGAPNMLRTPLSILEFSDMRERGYLPRIDEARPFERRWCHAQALISDGHRRPVYYIIEFPMGLAAIGGYVGLLSQTTLGFRAEGCVVGLDRWRIYGAECQSLRRIEDSDSRRFLPH
ncbi:hypothetical protein [Antarcticirhabdus aurantiaca]|uniref:Uncharacterized protein n=1 Tax=Antarcticirhabdus aurantiaca TaxID=2606717 RepID=A0ACD4NUN4_9HYPH|nr:hypothetical protein [Antarcticirhabdus aurantiaca]WAJ30463.1 hypothetical protein OXU80_09780 [Jeongeuplla avenae]